MSCLELEPRGRRIVGAHRSTKAWRPFKCLSTYFVFLLCVRKKDLQIMPKWAVVVAQLVERYLPIPEVRGSNPVIVKIVD